MGRGSTIVSQDFVIRMEPEYGPVPPYDVEKQYRLLKILENTSVPVPRVYWLEKDNSPQLYISSELNNDTLNIKILNMGDVAKDIIISYSSWGYELGDKTDPIPYL